MLTSCGVKFRHAPSLMRDADFLLGRGSQPRLLSHPPAAKPEQQSSLLGFMWVSQNSNHFHWLKPKRRTDCTKRPPPGTRDTGQAITKDGWTWDLEVPRDHKPLVIASHFLSLQTGLVGYSGRRSWKMATHQPKFTNVLPTTWGR